VKHFGSGVGQKEKNDILFL